MEKRGSFVFCFCAIVAMGAWITACISPPPTRRLYREVSYERTGEETRWRHLQERMQRDDAFADDDSLNEAPPSSYANDPTLDPDMRIVLECRDAVERENGRDAISQSHWFVRFADALQTKSNGTARIEVASREQFHAPGTIAEDAWCFWYIRDNRRREITVDPETRELTQAFAWVEFYHAR